MNKVGIPVLFRVESKYPAVRQPLVQFFRAVIHPPDEFLDLGNLGLQCVKSLFNFSDILAGGGVFELEGNDVIDFCGSF